MSEKNWAREIGEIEHNIREILALQANLIIALQNRVLKLESRLNAVLGRLR